LLSHASRSSDGGARSSPSAQRLGALGEVTQADRCGSIFLVPFVAVLVPRDVAVLDRLAVRPGHRETRDGD
jgi:hypothetical protein